MKPNAHARMKDPYFGYLMAVIEQVIARADSEVDGLGRQFTDSQVRSSIIKAIKTAKGQKPVIPVGSDHEKLLADLIARILQKRADILTKVVDEDDDEPEDGDQHCGDPVPLDDWIQAMETVEASMKIRTEMSPGSRGYLEFIRGFLKEIPAAIVIDQ